MKERRFCWLPVIGPSATWMLRRLAAGLTPHPDGYPVDVAELAAALGLGTGTGRNAPVMRTLRRLVTFGLASAQDEATVGVRRRVPPLVQPQVRPADPSAAAGPRTASGRPPTRGNGQLIAG